MIYRNRISGMEQRFARRRPGRRTGYRFAAAGSKRRVVKSQQPLPPTAFTSHLIHHHAPAKRDPVPSLGEDLIPKESLFIFPSSERLRPVSAVVRHCGSALGSTSVPDVATRPGRAAAAVRAWRTDGRRIHRPLTGEAVRQADHLST